MDLVNIFNKFNWETIIGMFIISWYFTREIREDLKQQGRRTDKLYEMFIDLLKEGRK